MHPLFLVGDLMYCGYERGINPANCLSKIGHQSNVSMPFEIRDFDQNDIYIFQRPYHYLQYDNCMRAKFVKKPIVIDMDDFHSALPQGNLALIKHQQNPEMLKVHDVVLNEADLLTASTEYLGKAMSMKHGNKPYKVLKNAIDFDIWDNLVDLKSIYPKEKDELRIGFMGASSHINDLKIVERVLVELINYYPFLKLVFFGYMPEYIKANIKPERYISKEFMRIDIKSNAEARIFPQEFKNLQIDIGIRPLLSIPFNFAKSLQTFMQGSALKIPYIVSDILTHDEIPNDCVIKVPHNEDEWRLALKRLIETETLRKYLADNAYTYIKRNHNIAVNINQWLETYEELIEQKKKYVRKYEPTHYDKSNFDVEWIVWLNDCGNGNNDGSLELLKDNAKIKIIESEDNVSFSNAHNEAVEEDAEGDFIVLLNNDVLPKTRGWLEKMFLLMQYDKTIGIVGCKLMFPYNRIQSIGTVFNDGKVPYHIYYDEPNALGLIQLLADCAEVLLNPKLTYDEKNKEIERISIFMPEFRQYVNQPVEKWQLGQFDTVPKKVNKGRKVLTMHKPKFRGLHGLMIDKMTALRSGKIESKVSFYSRFYREYQAVTAACMMIRREIWEKIGGFDNDFVFNYEDVALCLMTRKLGYKVIYCSDIEMYHWECGSGTKPENLEKNKAILLKKYGDMIKPDARQYYDSVGYKTYPVKINLKKELKLGKLNGKVSIITLSRNGRKWLEMQKNALEEYLEN